MSKKFLIVLLIGAWAFAAANNAYSQIPLAQDGPCAVMCGDRLAVFARTPQHTLTHKYYDKAWSNWIPLGEGELSSGPSVAFASVEFNAPAAVTPLGPISGKRQQTFVLSRAMHEVLTYKCFDGNQWNGWEFPAEGKITSAPAAVIAGNRLVVFARNDHNTLSHMFRELNDTKWSNWIELGAGEISSAPSAVMAGDRLTVFARTMHGTLTHKFFDGTKWSDWVHIGDGQISSAPSAVMAGDRLTVFARNAKGTLSHTYFDGKNWSNWMDVGDGEISSAPSALMANGRLTVFAHTMHGTLCHKFFDGNKWSDWIFLGDEKID